MNRGGAALAEHVVGGCRENSVESVRYARPR